MISLVQLSVKIVCKITLILKDRSSQVFHLYMNCKYLFLVRSCVSACFLYTWGRVWVQHLSFAESHCRLSFWQWPMFRLLICIHLHMSTNKEKLGWPLSERQLTVAFGETQVLNSNSTSGQQDPRMYLCESTIYIPNLDPVVSSCWPSSPGDFTSKAKLLPSTI